MIGIFKKIKLEKTILQKTAWHGDVVQALN